MSITDQEIDMKGVATISVSNLTGVRLEVTSGRDLVVGVLRHSEGEVPLEISRLRPGKVAQAALNFLSAIRQVIKTGPNSIELLDQAVIELKDLPNIFGRDHSLSGSENFVLAFGLVDAVT